MHDRNPSRSGSQCHGVYQVDLATFDTTLIRWTQRANSSEDWNIVTVPQTNAFNRLIKLTRGRFLRGSSGISSTLCVRRRRAQITDRRGIPQDFDDWGVKGWSGAEIWFYMNKAENFNPKIWFKHDSKNRSGNSGFLHTEPHDPAPIINMVLKSMESQGRPYDPDIFTTGSNPHGCSHSVRGQFVGIDRHDGRHSQSVEGG